MPILNSLTNGNQLQMLLPYQSGNVNDFYHYKCLCRGEAFARTQFIDRRKPTANASPVSPTINSFVPKRRSIRLKGYDYSIPGAYFVTLVTRNMRCLFGEIIDGTMHLNNFGEITQSIWRQLPDSFHVELDEFIVMPNHIHGMIWISDRNMGEASANGEIGVSIPTKADASPLQPSNGTQKGSLGAVIQNFKSISTRKIHQCLGRGEAFARTQYVDQSIPITNASPEAVWQRNYYDRIIRDEKELNQIRLYIMNNSYRWTEEPESHSRRTSCS